MIEPREDSPVNKALQIKFNNLIRSVEVFSQQRIYILHVLTKSIRI